MPDDLYARGPLTVSAHGGEMSETTTETIWPKVLKQLSEKLKEGQFATWFSKTSCLEVSDDLIRVGVPNNFYYEWLTRQYAADVKVAAAEVVGRELSVVFEVVESEEDEEAVAANEADAPAPQELPPGASFGAQADRVHSQQPVAIADPNAGRTLQLNDEYTFEHFVVGPGNRMAHAAAMAVVEQPGRIYNPLFIHGGLGLGKTHVLQGICHELMARQPGLRILYTPCEQFVNRFIAALEKGCVDLFRDQFRMLDVLVIDDVHFLANKEQSQEEFFHTFNVLYEQHKQIILSSDSAPKEIPTIEERLVSRFKWGLVCKMEKPTFETRMAIIRKKAAGQSLALPDDVVEHLAMSLKTSVREIEGAVTSLIGYCSLMNEPMTLDTARVALGDLIGSRQRRVTVDHIIALVTEHYNVKLSDLQSKKRFQSITLPRQVCMFLARKYTNHSLAEIGGYFGGRDHSTVLYATEKIEGRQKDCPKLKRSVDEISQALEA